MKWLRIATGCLVLVSGTFAPVLVFPDDASGIPVPADTGRLPEVTLPDLEDRQRSITEWSGRALIINFWATWCPPCRREIPLLRDLQERQGDAGLQVIGIALDNPGDVKRFLSVTPVNYPMLYGEHEGTVFAEELAESMDDAFVGLPFSAVIAPDGEILLLHSGELLADDLDRIIAELEEIASGRRTVQQARAQLAM